MTRASKRTSTQSLGALLLLLRLRRGSFANFESHGRFARVGNLQNISDLYDMFCGNRGGDRITIIVRELAIYTMIYRCHDDRIRSEDGLIEGTNTRRVAMALPLRIGPASLDSTKATAR